MTAQVLAAELNTIIQDSKRKHAEVRTAAEKSLADLKGLPNTSEAQLATDLRRRPHFVQPFLLACASKNPRLAGPAVSCLQRLVVTSGLHPDALKDVLDAIRDCSSLAQDVQLKILQLLPSLLQNYGNLVVDELLATELHTCFLLLSSKNVIVSNTAAATLQQVVVAVFDRVVKEDQDTSQDGLILDLPTADGWVSVRQATLDCHRLLTDICLLIDGKRPEFLTGVSLQANFGLDMIESILVPHAGVIVRHPELVHVLRLKLLPFIIRALSEKLSFPTTVRALRILPMILSRMLSVLIPECEMALGLLNHLLDPDVTVPWKRVLCMELLRAIHLDSDLVREIFITFDLIETRRNIVQDQMAVMVRVASERPTVIGLGQQSSVPFSSGQVEDEADEMAALQAEGISGTIGVAMTVKSSTAHGISTRISTVKIPCLEQGDKPESPAVPASYIYSLALNTMNSFSDGLAKFLLPFTIPSEVKQRRRAQTKDGERRPSSSKLERADSETKRLALGRSQSHSSRVPVNPLALKDQALYEDICGAAAMVDRCWPALLAAYSTYFHAALDSDHYRALVRSFQKFTQVAGLLRLETPRDALLTTLSKNAMPSGPLSLLSMAGNEQRPSSSRTSSSMDDRDETDQMDESEPNVKSSIETPRASLNARNLLCLRAMLNLGIALGAVLGTGWVIILETLQQADFLINHVTNQQRKARGSSASTTDDAEFLGDVGTEIAAVGAAATRMLESTSDLPDEAYSDVVSSLSGLFRDVSLRYLAASGAHVGHRRAASSVVMVHQAHDSRLNLFVIDQMTKIVKFNSYRLLQQSTKTSGWTVMTQSLQRVISASYLDHVVRQRATKALIGLVTLTASREVVDEVRDEFRLLGLQEIRTFVGNLYDEGERNSKGGDEDLHWLGLESLRSMLEFYGDTLSSGWEDVFAIVISVFENPSDLSQSPRVAENKPAIVCRSSKLMRSAFGSLQLICSDFLTSLPDSCFLSLMHAVHAFTDQQEDLNTSLTATTLYTSVADLHWRDLPELHLDQAMTPKGPTSASSSKSSLNASTSMHLFRLVVSCSTDSRMEVRHGAIYSLFRILEGHTDRFRPEDWIICLRSVILELFARNQRAYEASAEYANNWNETAILLLENTSSLLEMHIADVLSKPDFKSIWAHFVLHMRQLLSRETLTVSAAVFMSIEKIFSSKAGPTLETISEPVWDLWMNCNPVRHKEPSRKILDNQPALMAYLSCFIQLHQIAGGRIDAERLPSVMDSILLTATRSSPTAFAGDIDSLTPLQVEVLECIKCFKPDAEAFLLIAQSVSTLVTLPFDAQLSAEHKGPTFVALSKRSMEILESHITSDEADDDFRRVKALKIALRSLKRPIALKYGWKLEGKPPAPWQKATSVTVRVLEAVLPNIPTADARDSTLESLWDEVLESFAAIISTAAIDDVNWPTPHADLDFDIASAETVYRLGIPALGAPNLSDEVRRSFAYILFQHSIIHEPHPDDLPPSDKEPLAAIHVEHIGRTNDLHPSARARMAYALLQMLFDLVAVCDGSKERVKLAQAAAPYLILRVSLTLKAYISDQPLRGRMPQPRSQRSELLWILDRLVALDSEPRAIPEAPGFASQHKKHLFRVVPLVRAALPVARNDAAVHRALEQVLEVIAAEFGI